MRILALAFLVVLLPAFCAAQSDTVRGGNPDAAGYSKKAVTLTTAPQNFDPARDAAKDIRQAIVEASSTGKRIMLDVGGEWCIWCHRLDTLFLQNPDLDMMLHANFVVVKINVSPENENEALLAKYPKVAGYPHLFVLDADGTLLHSQDTGALESGKRHDPEKVRAFLTAWAPRKQGHSKN